jgi:hypothetical protein
MLPLLPLLPLFIADSYSVRLKRPSRSVSAVVKSRPCTPAASLASIRPLLSLSAPLNDVLADPLALLLPDDGLDEEDEDDDGDEDEEDDGLDADGLDEDEDDDLSPAAPAIPETADRAKATMTALFSDFMSDISSLKVG